MGKLKDMGNWVLGKFGLSLDNFKAVQDPKTGKIWLQCDQPRKGVIAAAVIDIDNFVLTQPTDRGLNFLDEGAQIFILVVNGDDNTQFHGHPFPYHSPK